MRKASINSSPHGIVIEPISPLTARSAHELFATVVAELPYYNERAKSRELENFSTKAVATKCQDEPGSMQLAMRGGAVVGVGFSWFDEYLLMIDWICVRQDARRLGVASQLCSALEDYGRTRDCHKSWLDTRTSNIASLSFFKKRGYKELCTMPDHWWGQDFAFLIKQL